MSPDVYEFDITRAESPADLHALREDILADDTLDGTEKSELLESIRLKYCARNLAALGAPQPEW